MWIAFAREADRSLDLLITPVRTQSAGAVALAISNGIARRSEKDANIGYLQGIVAVNLDFEELLRVVVPMTEWWHNPRNQKELQKYTTAEDGAEHLSRTINVFLPAVRRWNPAVQNPLVGRPLAAVDRYLALAGLILWARWKRLGATGQPAEVSQAAGLEDVTAQAVTDLLSAVFVRIQEDEGAERAQQRVWQVSLNRTALPAVLRSVPAVKVRRARKGDCLLLHFGSKENPGLLTGDAHHGSANNVASEFFERITADHYVFSGNGEHGNPERESLEMLFAARGTHAAVVHLTYPIDEIDVLRKEDWEREQAKEKKRKAKNPGVKVRPNWSAKRHSLAAFFDDRPLAPGQRIEILTDDTAPHVIDLLEKT